MTRWKQAERRLGKLFGARRRPLSGSNSASGGMDDCMHERLYLESKNAKYQPLWRLYRDTRDKARKEGKVPCIGLTEMHGKGILLVVHEDDLITIAHEFGLAMVMAATHAQSSPEKKRSVRRKPKPLRRS